MTDSLPKLSETDLASLVDQKNSDNTTKPKYRDWSMSRRSIIDVLAADKYANFYFQMMFS